MIAGSIRYRVDGRTCSLREYSMRGVSVWCSYACVSMRALSKLWCQLYIRARCRGSNNNDGLFQITSRRHSTSEMGSTKCSRVRDG